jgi:hypothetical protein
VRAWRRAASTWPACQTMLVAFCTGTSEWGILAGGEGGGKER